MLYGGQIEYLGSILDKMEIDDDGLSNKVVNKVI